MISNVRSTNPPDHVSPCCAPVAPHSDKSSRPEARVLLIDDDFAVRDSLGDVLTGEGYVVFPAENGQQAVDLAGQLPVDLALLDLNMPLKNGWDTFQELTRQHPLIPIIIATARPNQLFTALSAGAGALLEKPIDVQTLLQTIESLLAESAEQHVARLAGEITKFTYKPATGSHKHNLGPQAVVNKNIPVLKDRGHSCPKIQ